MAYTTSREYEKIIYSGEATENRIRIWFNEVELEDADNYCEKLSASSRLLPSSSSNRFSLDNFVSKELTLILHEVSLDKIVDQVKISLGTLVNGEYEDIPLGVFNIQDKPITDKDKITIKLRDNAIKFDFNYNAKPIIDSNGGSATKLQIFEDICSKAGVNTKVASFANSSDLIGIYDNTIKARAYIYYLAEQCGAIPTIDREGELIFVYINNLEVQRIPLSSIEKFEIGDKYRISKVIYEDAIRKYQSGNDNYDKLFLNSANPYISNQNQVNSIGSVVNGFEIDSLKTGKVLGNPAIDPYDIIEIYDDENGEELIIARTLANYSLTYNGVITNIYDTQIGLEARKENVSVNSEPTFKKWATTEINNLDASIKLSAGKISTLEEKTNTQTEQINSLEITASSTTSKISNIENDLSTTNQNLSDLEKEIQGVSVDFEDFKDTEYAETIQNIQDQLDGAIQFWSGTETPTLNNFPANQWTTEALKNEHQGDIYDVLEGETIVSSYKFIKIDGVYEWRIMSDSEISAVKQLAQEALNKANQNKSDIEVINGSVTELQQTDEEIKASVSEIKTEVVPTGQASGSNIHITDSADAELLDFKLYGKSTQETRSGKNLFNINGEYSTYHCSITKNETGFRAIATDEKTLSRVVFPFHFVEGQTYTISFDYTSSGESLTGFHIYGRENYNSGTTITDRAYPQIGHNELSLTATTTGDFYLWFYFNSSASVPIDFDIELTNIQIEVGSIATEYEAFGIMPSPDYPSEIESVGYQNLFNGWKIGQRINATTGELYDSDVSAVSTDYIPVDFEKNPNYYLDGLSNQLFSLVGAYDKDKNFLGRTPAGGKTYYSLNENSFTSNHVEGTIAYLLVSIYENNSLSGKIDLVNDLNTMLNVGDIAKNYIPFGKYGVEVETISKNIFNEEKLLNQESGYNTYDSTTGLWTTTSQSLYSKSILYNVAGSSSNRDINKLIKLKPNTTYYVKLFDFVNNTTNSTDALQYGLFDSNGVYISNIVRGLDTATFTTPADYDEVYLDIRRYSNSGTMSFSHIQISQDEFDEYEPYKLTQTLIQSDYPLMSNKDESVKDYVYLQNGNLYLKKYINEIVLNGSENWQDRPNYTYADRFILNGVFPNNHKKVLSNYFEFTTSLQDIFPIATNNSGQIVINFSAKGTTTLAQFKTWLSENNVKVQYELAEPQDILIVENVDSLITYKNVTNISTNDDLQPNMEAVYVKDNTLNDIYQTQNGMNKYYTKVENDALLEITDEKIESSVTQIRSAMDTIKETVDRIDTTYLTQTANQFEMLFKQTGIKELVDSVDALTKSNNATLVEQEQWIRFKGGNIELGRSDSQVKLLLSNDRISFLTGGNESAYISNNQLYITDSTILNKLQVGHWETIEEDGNLNTRWIEGVI